MEPWPFADEPNVAVVSTRQIMSGQDWIESVSHFEDGDWAFSALRDFSVEDGVLVGLDEVVAVDPSICELADLPTGWSAARAAKGAPWIRRPTPDDEF